MNIIATGAICCAAGLAFGGYFGYDYGKAKCISNLEKEKEEIVHESTRKASAAEELENKRRAVVRESVRIVETVVDEHRCLDVNPPRDIIDRVRQQQSGAADDRSTAPRRVPTAADGIERGNDDAS